MSKKIVNEENLENVKELIKQARIKLMPVNPDLLMRLFLSRKPILVDMKGLPEDAILLAINFDPRCNMLLLKLVSKEFESIKEGEVIPFIEGTVTQIECTCDCKDKTLEDVTTPINAVEAEVKPIPEEK
jgi:hypothetical protein